MQDVEDLLTVAEAAVLIRRKPRWLAEQARLRLVPFTRIGRTVLFTRGQVAQIIRESAVAADEVAPELGITARSLAKKAS